MSTRSIIAAEFDNGEVKGVYKHSDGYPGHTLVRLQELIARDGREKVVKTLLGRPSGWSNISEDFLHPGYNDDGRFVPIKGYGTQYNHKPVKMAYQDKKVVQGDTKYRTPGDGGEEYFYVIRKDGAVVWTYGDGDTGPWYTRVPDSDDGDVPAGFGYPTWDTAVGPKTFDEDALIKAEQAIAEILAEQGVSIDQYKPFLGQLLAAADKSTVLG